MKFHLFCGLNLYKCVSCNSVLLKEGHNFYDRIVLIHRFINIIFSEFFNYICIFAALLGNVFTLNFSRRNFLGYDSLW